LIHQPLLLVVERRGQGGVKRKGGKTHWDSFKVNWVEINNDGKRKKTVVEQSVAFLCNRMPAEMIEMPSV